VNEIFIKIYEKVGRQWRKFMMQIDRNIEGSEKNEIKIEKFKQILKTF